MHRQARTSRRRSLTARLLALAVATTSVVIAIPAMPASAAVIAGATKYVPIEPTRIARNFTSGSSAPFGYTTVSSTTMRVKVTDRTGVPADAIAAVVNITAISNVGAGFVSVYPSASTRPNSSNLNLDKTGRRLANLAHVRLGTDGAFDLYSSKAFQLIVDLVGVYVPVTDTVSEGRFVARPGGAIRALDTRQAAGSATNPDGIGRFAAGTTASVDLAPFGVPNDASAVVIGLTAVNANLGYWTTYATGTARPGTSSQNIDTPLQTRAAQAIVALTTGQASIDVYAHGGGDLIIDVVGWYTGAGGPRSQDGLFLPRAPSRRLDTRQIRSLAPWGGSTYEFTIPNPPSCTNCLAAAVLNVTATQPWTNGYVTAYPAGQTRPSPFSTLNINSWPQTIANHAITGITSRGGAVYTLGGAHLIVDLAGVFLGTPLAATYPKPANPNYVSNLATRVYSSQVPVNVGIRTGSNLDYIADQGYAAGWTGLTNVATRGNVMLFGHRTASGAPFRYLDQFDVNEKFVIVGTDGKRYEYLVMDKRVVRPDYSTILQIASGFGPVTAQLVACSRADGTPTSLSYRIVITGRLVRVF
ncbi:MAG: hypothetical protein RJB61_2439 [Actinomycetota bacterium]